MGCILWKWGTESSVFGWITKRHHVHRDTKTVFLRFTREKYYSVWSFQQDKASAHSAKKTKHWIWDRNIDSMDWKARNFDLNPIEDPWGTMTRRAYAHVRQFDTVLAPKTAVFEKWAKIDWSLCYRIVRNVSNKCAAALERQDLKIAY